MIDYYQSSSPFATTKDQRSKGVNMMSVLSILNYFLYVLQSNFIDFAIVRQFFEHTFTFIDAFLFDILLLRKDLCCRKKGAEIRYNVRKLERWLDETGQVNAYPCLNIVITDIITDSCILCSLHDHHHHHHHYYYYRSGWANRRRSLYTFSRPLPYCSWAQQTRYAGYKYALQIV